MTRFLVPKKSGVHRVASIALFRALLSQISALNVPEETQNVLQNVVRNRFKKNRHVHSKRLLPVAFKAGYEALDLLDASVAGETASLSQIHTLLAQTPAHLKRTPKPSPLLKTPKTKTPAAPRDPNRSVLARPRPQISGKRHIPVLALANGIPFLRIKKPQPYALSAYLRSRIKQRAHRLERVMWFEDMARLAEMEDRWDEILSEQFGTFAVGDGLRERQREGSWTKEYFVQAREAERKLEEEKRNNLKRLEVLHKIVEKEKALAEKEEAERATRSG